MSLAAIFMTLVLIVIVLAAFGLVWWAISRIALPEPFKTVVLLIFGLFGLFVLYEVVINRGISLH